MTSSARTAERTDFLACILITAVEGGIGYWAETRNYHWTETPEHTFTKASVEVRDVITDKGAWRRIDLEDIETGLTLIKKGLVELRRDLLADILVGDVTNDAGKIDCDGADCIVQAVLFSELVYG